MGDATTRQVSANPNPNPNPNPNRNPNPNPNPNQVVKSTSDLRIAFLRQEFREEMDQEATLRAELSKAFSDVLQLQAPVRVRVRQR